MEYVNVLRKPEDVISMWGTAQSVDNLKAEFKVMLKRKMWGMLGNMYSWGFLLLTSLWVLTFLWVRKRIIGRVSVWITQLTVVESEFQLESALLPDPCPSQQHCTRLTASWGRSLRPPVSLASGDGPSPWSASCGSGLQETWYLSLGVDKMWWGRGVNHGVLFSTFLLKFQTQSKMCPSLEVQLWTFCR